MNFQNYVNLAKVKNNISSNNKVAKCIGISSAAITNFCLEKSTPSPHTVLKLANLAGLDEKEVFLELMLSKYGKFENVKKVLIDIKNITCKK